MIFFYPVPIPFEAAHGFAALVGMLIGLLLFCLFLWVVDQIEDWRYRLHEWRDEWRKDRKR